MVRAPPPPPRGLTPPHSCTPTAEAFNLALQMFKANGKNQIKVAYVITDGYRAPSAAPSLRTGN